MERPKDKYAWTVKVGEKGQFVIPKEAREIFGIEPGDSIIVLGDLKQGLAIPPKSALREITEQIFGQKSTKGDMNNGSDNNN